MLKLNQPELDIVTVDFHGLHLTVSRIAVRRGWYIAMDKDGDINVFISKPSTPPGRLNWLSGLRDATMIGQYKGDTTGWEKSAIQLHEQLIVTATGGVRKLTTFDLGRIIEGKASVETTVGSGNIREFYAALTRLYDTIELEAEQAKRTTGKYSSVGDNDDFITSHHKN